MTASHYISIIVVKRELIKETVNFDIDIKECQFKPEVQVINNNKKTHIKTYSFLPKKGSFCDVFSAFCAKPKYITETEEFQFVWKKSS